MCDYPHLQVRRVRPTAAKWVLRECRSRRGAGLGFGLWSRLHPDRLCDIVQICNPFGVSSLSGGGGTRSMTLRRFFPSVTVHVLALFCALLQDRSRVLRAYPCTCPNLYNKSKLRPLMFRNE